MSGENTEFRDLSLREYDIAGNVFRAWFDDDGLAVVVDETIDEYKPNVLLVVRPRDSRKWDDLLANTYNIDLELVRPKKDNKYQKLDVEYGGTEIYEKLIREYENHGDIKGALADLMDFRDAAVRRSALGRLNAAQEEMDLATATATKAQNSIRGLGDRVRSLRGKLARQKERIGREPAKQSASRILRTESQIESTEEKKERAEKRLENARRRIDAATEEINAINALLARRRPSVDDVGAKPKVIEARTKKNNVAKMPVPENENKTEEINEPEESEMSKESNEVKPLLDKDPEIMDEEIAFKPVNFDDLPSPYADEPSRPLSPYDSTADDEPKPEVADDVGDENDKPFGFPEMTTESSAELEAKDDDKAVDTPESADVNNDTESNVAESDSYAVEEKTESEEPQAEESEPENDGAPESDSTSLTEFTDNFRHDDLKIHEYADADNTETDNVATSVETPSDSEHHDNVDEAPKRPFTPVEVPKMPVNNTRPMSPISADERPRPVGGKRSSFAYYVLLILLIALSVFTLWLYQNKHGGTVPFLGMGERVEQPVSKDADVEPDVPVVPAVQEEPDEPVVLPTPVVEPVPVVAPAPAEKPIEVRFPNDDILRGPEPEVPVVESEEDVLARKAPYGVSRDDKPVFIEAPEPVIETVVETVVEEPVINVTTVTAPDVIFEDDVVSVPMPMMNEDVDFEYENSANVPYVPELYVVEQPRQYVPEPQYVPKPQYVESNYDYVEEPMEETRRNLTIHDGGQYSVTETVVYRAN